MSGDEMVSEIRRNVEFDTIPIIILTAKSDDTLRLKLLREGAQDYVMKPFSADELKVRVRNLVTAKRTRDLLKKELTSSKNDLEDLAQEVTLRRHELEKALEETRASRDEAQRLLQLRDEFVSVAGHELKTPLTPLNIQRQMIQRVIQTPGVPESVKEQKFQNYLDMSKHQIEALSNLIETLLDVSRIRLGNFSLKIEEGVDLPSLVREVAERYRPQSEAAKCPVSVNVFGRSPSGRWDRLRLEQVVSNLLTNAIKYGKGKSIEITVSGYSNQGKVSVKDHGEGIADDDKARVFNRFERAGSIKSFGGLGLGLYIARQIVTAHGGAIRVESELGKGATFVVELPLDSSVAIENRESA